MYKSNAFAINSMLVMIVFRWLKKAKLIASPVFFSPKSFSGGTFATFLTVVFTEANLRYQLSW